MIVWILIGLGLVGMLAYVVVTILDDIAENHEGPGAAAYDTGWGPDADKPVDYWLTGLGEGAAANRSEFVLEESGETWGPSA